MRGNRLFSIIPQFGFISILGLSLFASGEVVAQSTSTDPPAQPNVQSAVSSNQTNIQNSSNMQPAPGPSAEEIEQRIDRARALAAAHQLEAAASELETARANSRDVVVRQGTSIMLMGIYLEAGNYARAQSLLEETFQTRSAAKESSLRNYFALAGQTVNAVRLHLARYRNFGVSVASATLPPEATNDLDRARSLLERIVAQTKEIMTDAATANDGLALREDVLGIRLSLARDDADRDKWQGEYTQAREQLGSGEMQIASVAGRPRPAQNQTKVIQATSPTQDSVSSPTSTGANATSQPETIEAGALNDKAKSRVVPTYPQMAKTAHAEGIVRVHVIVNERGEVEVTKSEGPMLLRSAAEQAARGWRFSPALVEGKPVRLTGYIEFSFAL